MGHMTLQDAADEYLDSVSLARSPNTARTYRNALAAFAFTLERLNVDQLAAGTNSWPLSKSLT
jgi:hypothetical protein